MKSLISVLLLLVISAAPSSQSVEIYIAEVEGKNHLAGWSDEEDNSNNGIRKVSGGSTSLKFSIIHSGGKWTLAKGDFVLDGESGLSELSHSVKSTQLLGSLQGGGLAIYTFYEDLKLVTVSRQYRAFGSVWMEAGMGTFTKDVVALNRPGGAGW